MPDPGSILTRNWLHFGRILRGLGFDAGPARMLPFLTALTVIDSGRPDDLRTAVRIHFARRRDDLRLLDRALGAFLGAPTGAAVTVPSAEVRETQPGETATLTGRQLKVLDDVDAAEGAEELEVASYSRVEVLRERDFDTLTEAEMAEVRRLIRLMRLPAGLTRSRRARPGGRDRLDIRRLLRRSLRFGGELLVFSWKSPTQRPRPLVLLCDISGSMERYTRLLLNFTYALKTASTRVEAFVFATRLTRITHLLRSHDVDAALNRVMASVDDWSGGTRIGEAIETFNRRYARRVLSQPDAERHRPAAALLPPADLDESPDGRTRLRATDPGAAGSVAVCRRFPAGPQPGQPGGAGHALARDGWPAPGPPADAGRRDGLRPPPRPPPQAGEGVGS